MFFLSFVCFGGVCAFSEILTRAPPQHQWIPMVACSVGPLTKRRCKTIPLVKSHRIIFISPCRKDTSFVVSGSQDCTLKLWAIPDKLRDQETVKLHSKCTEQAHDKDINAVVVSPNDRLVATGKQRTTALSVGDSPSRPRSCV